MRKDSEKTAAVATVVAAVDQAMVREPAPGVVEQTAKRTAMTAVHVQPVQEQVEIQHRHSMISPLSLHPTCKRGMIHCEELTIYHPVHRKSMHTRIEHLDCKGMLMDHLFHCFPS